MLTTNRPNINISHMVIPMVDSIKNLSNLDFLVSVPFHPPMSYPPKSIIFIDHKLSTAAVARYLNTRLPEAVRRVFKFQHLHSSMSTEHNEMVFNEFRKSNGLIQGVVATSGASTGINVADIRLVIQFGITIDICEHEQRAGQGGRNRRACLVLMITEKWAYKSPENVHVSHKGKPTAKERRTEPTMLEFVNTSTCRRQFLAEYNNDTTAEAFEYDSPCCCDQHLDSTNIDYFLPGTTLPSIALKARLELDTSGVNAQAPPKKTHKRYRPTKQRPLLEEQLKAWRTNILSNDPAIQSWPDEWVLSDLSISKLAQEDEAIFKSSADVVSFLEESREQANSFADQVHDIIDCYNRSLPRKSTQTSRQLVTSGATANQMPGSEDDELEQHLPETHIPADPIPSLVNTAYHLYDTDATLVNSHSPPSSLPSSQCATPDLDLPLSAAIHHLRSESTFESPNPQPKKRALIVRAPIKEEILCMWTCKFCSIAFDMTFLMDVKLFGDYFLEVYILLTIFVNTYSMTITTGDINEHVVTHDISRQQDQ
ncbi:uncharacterized protein EDB91DRAFT_1080914 [Suillus paluster]|uniref:uncharacterized protein n=1 Tax=Suillus paluster TaxID=48578 RepID=UPI001B86787A|nr:uncharacterized protein EDB91DRAFT_1080914 [Suillus paluster]KAG1744113.1 hypothetical protein EDB91DRAFT_1080914 [Suillus paluster]